MQILIADPETLFQDALHILLETGGHTIVATATTEEQIFERARLFAPQVLLVDPNALDGSATTGLQRLREAFPELKVVVLTSVDEEHAALSALQTGVAGYILKTVSGVRLLGLLSMVEEGELALSPSLAHRLVRAAATRRQGSAAWATASDAPATLTARETEVLQQLVLGRTSSRSIARALGIGETTAKFHVRNILDKLRLHSRAQAVAYALHHHLARPARPTAVPDERRIA